MLCITVRSEKTEGKRGPRPQTRTKILATLSCIFQSHLLSFSNLVSGDSLQEHKMTGSLCLLGTQGSDVKRTPLTPLNTGQNAVSTLLEVQARKMQKQANSLPCLRRYKQMFVGKMNSRPNDRRPKQQAESRAWTQEEPLRPSRPHLGLQPSAHRTLPEWIGWSLSTKHKAGVRPEVRSIKSSGQAWDIFHAQ